MANKSTKTYEAYRHSDIFNRDDVIMRVKSNSRENAIRFVKEKLLKLYGDTRSFYIREVNK